MKWHLSCIYKRNVLILKLIIHHDEILSNPIVFEE